MIILVATEKGGVGKSTISTNLAVALRLAGKDIILVDIDPQGSATRWQRLRQEHEQEPRIPVVAMTGRIGADLLALDEKYEFVLVDAGGRDSIEIRDAALVADLWVIPAVASAFDSLAMDTALTICMGVERQTGNPPRAYTLINKVPTLPTIQDANELDTMLREDEDYAHYMPPLNSRLSERLDFQRSPRKGAGVLEYAPTGKAADEMRALCAELFEDMVVVP
ncbi:AAA family ATPase [Chitinimonas sp. BJB300]|uniref:AAA family ATPase n=1 Tax=Chitinimonas sp. BJB300 TaxID=1559339 RepID=UPI000C0FF9D6|nr:AAA family ATPase [Chitinimonas sp. BJB300]PHV10102.1 hypothetical protein CSQ89_18005 [Chitinimonas sp. BJB300]TSJ84648.1 AAA family ATPase [Chitinimonas sp. BJB300]